MILKMYIWNTSAKSNLMFTLKVEPYNTHSSVCHEARETGLPLKYEVIPGGQAIVQKPEENA